VAERTKGPRFYASEKTVAEQVRKLLSLLSEYGAQSYHVDNRGGRPSAVAFSLEGANGPLAFKVAPNVEGIGRRLREEGVKARGPDGAEGVAWAQLAELVRLQLEAVESGLASAEDVLGGFLLLESGHTVGEAAREGAREILHGRHLLLPSPRSERDP
jgi:hypothetical protein